MFYISISNGLLSSDHQKRMGPAVWQFMWIIDKVTKIDEDGVGWVLGGRPIKIRDLKSTGVSERTIQRNLERLEENKYIEIERAQYGIIIKVMKAKKTFGRRSDKNVISESATRSDKSVTPDMPHVASLPVKDGKSVSYNKSSIHISNTEEPIPSPFSLKEEIKKWEEDPKRHINIIAYYLDLRKPDIRTKEQFREVVNRHMKSAKALVPFDDDQILKASKKAAEMTSGWTLETVLKVLSK